MASVDDRKKKMHRSPAYPGVGLEPAIGITETIYEHERRQAAPIAVIARHCGTDIKSSKGLRLIAALKQFGLVDEIGSSEDRQIKLSDLALDIMQESQGSRPFFEALRKAALSPPIHKKIWDEFNGELPSDQTLRSFVTRKLDFNDTYAEKFIKQFRSTLAFADLAKSDKINAGDGAESDPEGDDDMDHSNQREKQDKPKGEGFSLPKPPSATRDFPLYTSQARGALYVPERMTAKDFELLKKQIENSLAVIEATAVTDE